MHVYTEEHAYHGVSIVCIIVVMRIITSVATAVCSGSFALCLALLTVEIILSVQDVLLQSVRQWKETHENRSSQAQSTQTRSDLQPAQMLQTAHVLWQYKHKTSQIWKHDMSRENLFHTQVKRKGLIYFVYEKWSLFLNPFFFALTFSWQLSTFLL